MESHNIARTREGHAAGPGMQDKWVLIQENTFRNWVNEQLKSAGLEVNNLENDFDDGARLCALISSLQNKHIRVIKNTRNHHQQLANVTQALTAIAQDNIRLVNIGPEDVVDGNLKLILGLIWHLILRYQIGKNKFPTKKLMIFWLQAVIPDRRVTNFTSDWNDGIALHALIDFCRPGLCPEWRHLSRSDGLDNCRNAMMLAKQHFDIPLVVRPEDLSSPDLDELSGMTYLSYFMKLDSPGFHATLNLVRRLLKGGTVNNFTSDWSNGHMLCKLVHCVGGDVPGYPVLSDNNVECMQMGIDAAKGLGIEPILAAKEMADAEVDHIAIMAYTAYFLKFKPVRTASEKVIFTSLPQHMPVGQEASFAISLEDDDVSAGDIRAEIIGSESTHAVRFNWVGRTGHGYFTPNETGLHRLCVFCEGQVINGCPASFKVMADRSKVTLSTVESCSLGTLTELQVNSAAAGDGDVQIQVRAPSGRSSNLSAVPRHGGNYISNFSPTEVGDYEVSVLYDNEHITGSPYVVNVFDASLVKVFGLEGGSMSSGITFNTDATKAGRGNTRFEVMQGSTDVTSQCHIKEEYNNFYKVNFSPPTPGSYDVHVYFNDTEIRGSPYNIDIVDSSNVTVSGDGLSLVSVNRTATFEVLAGGAGKVDVEITAPTGDRLPAHVNNLSKGSYSVQYMPNSVGDHKVDVYFGGEKIQGCPYTVRVWDASRVVVSGMPTSCVLGQPVVFDIDASKAGSGNIEIMINDGEIACSVQNHGNYRFTASFQPGNVQQHNVEMKFNSEQVPGSPWKIMILDTGKISAAGSGLEHVHVHRTAWFSVNMLGMDPKQLAIKIIAPSGSSVPYRVEQGASEFRVEYIPTEVGDHTIELKYADTEVGGSPFVAKAYNTACIDVTKLSDGLVGERIQFEIDVTKAGEGQLEIMVNSGNLPNTVRSDIAGVYCMSFVPEEAGRQKVEIIFNKESHPDSPFYCNAIDLNNASVRSLEMELPVDKPASFYVHSEKISEDLNATVDVSSPTGERVHAEVYRQGNGECRVEWMPRVAGRHTIHVQLAGTPVDGSPFDVDVFDLANIRVDNFRHGTVGDEACFSVDFSNAGTLDQTIQIVGPSGIDVVYDSRELGHLWKDYMYEAEEPGKYQIYIRYGGFQIPGCPFTQDIADGGLPSASGGGLFFGQEDKTSNVNVDVGRRKGDLRVSVSGPNSIAKCSVDPRSDGSYDVSYIPVETGIFDISITWNGLHIPGSPYHPKILDSRKVRIIGGWQHFMDSNERVNLEVGERKQLTFDIAEAGPGTLEAEVKGPSRSIDVNIDNHTIGRSTLEFVPEEEGTHYIHICWSTIPLVNSPFLGFAIQHTPDASKLILTGRGLKEALVREEAEFVIDGSQAGRGSPDVVLSGVRAEVSVKISPLGNGKFRCNYVPVLPGAYLLHITWNGRQLRGSPYKVNVTGAFYPNKVVVSGMSRAILGLDMNIGIDTRKAGPGELTAYCMGPHQVAYCELEDNHDGTFRLGVKAQESGRHVLQIKYGGEHVQDSPYVYKVTAQPDASKVRVHGPGVEHGILAMYISRFIVETRGAGAGQLTVRIRGPKGAFQVEMYRDSQRDRTILCRFDPTECGLYIISVKWSGVDVPGSPFHVHILDTQEELEQVLNEVSYSLGTTHSHGGSQMSHYGSQHKANQPKMAYGSWREQI